jgi:hypothetical protein
MKNERTAMTKTRLFAALSCSLCLISCGSSSTSNGIDASATSGDIDTSFTYSDTSATNSNIDAGSTNYAVDAGSTNYAVDAGSTNYAVDAGSTNYAADAGSGNICPNLAGAYILTTEIVSTTCKIGLHAITDPITYTFTQTAPSCNFTMANTVYPSSLYTGHFVMAGSQAKVIWDSVDPAPSAAGYAFSYTAVNLVITPGATVATSTIVGSFNWHSAADCDGTTNVCNGTVPAGCLTPQ